MVSEVDKLQPLWDRLHPLRKMTLNTDVSTAPEEWRIADGSG